MSEISETQSKLDELMNEYEVTVIGENRGRVHWAGDNFAVCCGE